MSEFIFSIQSSLLRGLHIRFPEICEIFVIKKLKTEFLEKYKKHYIQNRHAFKTHNCKYILYKN